ncbi:MAG: tyrosine-type recombinase/integrase [Planctomycetota bacterium]|jgi:integrase
MTIKEAVKTMCDHQKANLKYRSIYSYNYILNRFESQFGSCEIDSIGSDEICQFLESLTSGLSKATRRLRFSQMKTFFNFTIDHFDLNIKNPCSSSKISRSFKAPSRVSRKILEKETVDEMIYNAKNVRDRLLLELQARCGLRIGELLKLKVSDVSDRKLTIMEPKSRKDSEVAFMPEQIANRLNEYIKEKKLSPGEPLFPMCYSTARSIIIQIAKRLNVKMTPHDLRRHSATYASRNGVPLEMVSKVILRHRDLKTIQIYLGRVSDPEAIRWMDVLHGK